MKNAYEMFVSDIVDAVRKLSMNFVVLTNSPVVTAIEREKLTSDFVELTVEIFRANSIELKAGLDDDLYNQITDIVNELHADFQMIHATVRNIG